MAGFTGLAGMLRPRNAADPTLPSGPKQIAPQPVTQLGRVQEGGQKTAPTGPGRLLLQPAEPSLDKGRSPTLQPPAGRKGRMAAAGNLLLNPSGLA